MANKRPPPGGGDELSRLLIEIRGELSQTEAGRRAGLTQSKVSRAEAGRFPLSTAEAEAYGRAVGAAPAQLARLGELTRAFEAANITTRAALVRSARTIQERVARLEAECTLIRSWQPEIVVGVMQTPDYAAALLGDDPGPEWLATRAERVALLTSPSRSWHVLMSEAALRWGLGSARLMQRQIEHLSEVSQLPHVRLGLVPLDTVHPIPAPAAFHLFGDRVASVATETATAFLNEPADLDHYARLFAELAAIALYDDQAREILARAATSYKRDAAAQ